MARQVEPALRMRLSPSVDALVGRNGVHLLQGHVSFYLDARAARKLGDLWQDVDERGFDAAIADALRGVLPTPTRSDSQD